MTMWPTMSTRLGEQQLADAPNGHAIAVSARWSVQGYPRFLPVILITPATRSRGRTRFRDRWQLVDLESRFFTIKVTGEPIVSLWRTPDTIPLRLPRSSCDRRDHSPAAGARGRD